MKTKILSFLILPCFILFFNAVKGQAVNQNGSAFAVDTTMFPGIIQHQASSTPSTDSQALRGQRVMWLEYGDGSFTFLPNTTHNMGTSPNNYFLLTNKLYDTTHDLRMASNQFTGNQTGRTNGDNDSRLINQNLTGIFITPNIYDIVRNDTMAFGVTYHIGKGDYLPEYNYYIVFLYNTNTFDTFNANRIIINQLKSFRNSNGNVPITSLTTVQATFINGLQGYYGKYAVIKINNLNDLERNVFLSLFTKSALQAGGSTSLKAILLREPPSSPTINPPPQTIATYETASLSFRSSHDPNYITQYPVCMRTPKIARIFNYRVHFQNTGAGDADIVKVTVTLPVGMVLTNNSIILKSKNFATDQAIQLPYTVNQLANKIEFTLSKNAGSDLKGIDGLENAMVNPVTMGDIYFDVQSTDTTPNLLKAQASIEFRSAQTQNWETPVITNFATSYYSDCTDSIFCNCKIPGVDPIPTPPNPIPPQPNPDTCTKFLSLCWWWWVIIAIAGIIVYAVARKRKEK